MLVNLLHQGDLLNTVNGGIAETAFKVERKEDAIEIVVSNPAIDAEKYDINLNFNQLSVGLFMGKQHPEKNINYTAPLFYKVFEIPAYVDFDAIEASSDDKNLFIRMPFKTFQENLRRKIDIKNK